ncbi:MAG: carboxypeptidase regulatory-like domain-containing protein [Planctomycetota bacterium]
MSEPTLPELETKGATLERAESPSFEDWGREAAARFVEAGADGEIRGTARTKAGEALAGVRITVQAASAPEGLTLPDVSDVDLEGYLQSRAVYYHWLRASTRAATTDASGSYAIGELPEGSYQVTARLSGWTFETVPPSAWRVTPGQEVSFIGERQVALEVRILESDGAPASSGTVHVRRGTSTTGYPWSADQPVLQLEPGTCHISALRGDTSSPELAVTLEVDRAPQPLTLRLESRIGLRGRVEFPRGEVVESAIVHVMKVPGPQTEVTSKTLVSEGRLELVRPTDPSYEFLDVAPGWYAIGVGRSVRTAEVIEMVEVSSGVRRHDLSLPPLDPGRVIAVRATGPKGEPVPDLSFRLEVATSQNRQTSTADATIRPDGTYWILQEDAARSVLSGEVKGGVTLRVLSPVYGERIVVVEPAPNPSVDVTFGTQATLTVSVQGDLDSVVGGLEIRVQAAGDEDNGYRSGKKVVSDTTELGPLQPGSYTLALVNRNGLRLDQADVYVQEGGNTARLEVPPLYEVTVLMPEDLRGAGVLLAKTGEGGGMQFNQRRDPDSDGRVVYNNVPAGDYQLQAYSDRAPRIMTIQVPTAGEVRFEPSPINALLVRVSDPEGLLAKAGFQTGDLVIRIDGESFSTSEELTAVMIKLQTSDGPLTFTVSRGGRELDLQLDMKSLTGNPGGSLDPSVR